VVLNAVLIADIAGALWEGGESRLGKTYWQSIDSFMIAGASTTAMKYIFTRERPSTTDDPNKFFQGGSNHSFPSGEVAFMSAAVTPFVLEYGKESPAVYLLELLPVYDAIARVKVRAHWQSDVLVGFAVGAGTGYYAHSREQPIILTALPHGFTVGLSKSW